MAKHFIPDFMTGFACKCGSCRRSCCRDDWDIQLSENEYEADVNSPDPLCRAFAKRGLELCGGIGPYARCATDDHGFCRLLSADGLCSWRLRTGQCVGKACNEFPDTHIGFCGDSYSFPSIACEAVLEQLYAADSISLVSKGEAINAGRLHICIETEHFLRRPLLEKWPELGGFGAELLQRQDFSLDERVALLAHFLMALHGAELSGRSGEASALADSYRSREKLSSALGEMAGARANSAAFLALSCAMLTPLAGKQPYSRWAMGQLEALGFEASEAEFRGEKGLRISLAEPDRLGKQKELFRRRENELMPFLERITVCEFLRSMTPISGESVWDSCCGFLIWYAGCKACFYAGAELGRDRLIDSLVLMQRGCVHATSVSLREKMSAGGLRTPGDLIGIIRV